MILNNGPKLARADIMNNGPKLARADINGTQPWRQISSQKASGQKAIFYW